MNILFKHVASGPILGSIICWIAPITDTCTGVNLAKYMMKEPGTSFKDQVCFFLGGILADYCPDFVADCVLGHPSSPGLLYGGKFGTRVVRATTAVMVGSLLYDLAKGLFPLVQGRGVYFNGTLSGGDWPYNATSSCLDPFLPRFNLTVSEGIQAAVFSYVAALIGSLSAQPMPIEFFHIDRGQLCEFAMTINTGVPFQGEDDCYRSLSHSFNDSQALELLKTSLLTWGDVVESAVFNLYSNNAAFFQRVFSDMTLGLCPDNLLARILKVSTVVQLFGYEQKSAEDPSVLGSSDSPHKDYLPLFGLFAILILPVAGIGLLVRYQRVKERAHARLIQLEESFNTSLGLGRGGGTSVIDSTYTLGATFYLDPGDMSDGSPGHIDSATETDTFPTVFGSSNGVEPTRASSPSSVSLDQVQIGLMGSREQVGFMDPHTVTDGDTACVDPRSSTRLRVLDADVPSIDPNLKRKRHLYDFKVNEVGMTATQRINSRLRNKNNLNLFYTAWYNVSETFRTLFDSGVDFQMLSKFFGRIYANSNDAVPIEIIDESRRLLELGFVEPTVVDAPSAAPASRTPSRPTRVHPQAHSSRVRSEVPLDLLGKVSEEGSRSAWAGIDDSEV